MAVKLSGSLSITEIDTEWTLGFDLDSYRGTQWFLSNANAAALGRPTRGNFGPDSGSGYTAVSYSDFYGTTRLPPSMPVEVWLLGGGGGAGHRGGGGGGGGIRPATVTVTGGVTYTVGVGTGGSGGYRRPGQFQYSGPGAESTSGNASRFGNTYVGGGGYGSAHDDGGTYGYDYHGPGATFVYPQPISPIGGGGGGASERNEYSIGGKGGPYGKPGGNNIGYGGGAWPYGSGGGGGGGPQSTQGHNPFYHGYMNPNADRNGTYSKVGNGFYGPSNYYGGPNSPARKVAGPGGRGTQYWAPLYMGWHGGGGGAGWNRFGGQFGTQPGNGGQGGGRPGVAVPGGFPITGNSGSGTTVNGPSAQVNTGGGGGGGGSDNTQALSGNSRGGHGGSGAVWLRYAAPVIGTGGPANVHSTYEVSNYIVHKWTGSGTYTHGS